LNRESEGESIGIPHLAKNQRDMGHGGFKLQVQHFPLGDSCIWERVFNIWIWAIEPRFRRS